MNVATSRKMSRKEKQKEIEKRQASSEMFHAYVFFLFSLQPDTGLETWSLRLERRNKQARCIVDKWPEKLGPIEESKDQKREIKVHSIEVAQGTACTS